MRWRSPTTTSHTPVSWRRDAEEEEEVADPDPLDRKIDWDMLMGMMGPENMVEVITTGVATKMVLITGYLLAGKFMPL